MTLKEVLSILCVDSYVSVWNGPDGMNLLEHGTVWELLYGDEEDLPKLSEQTLQEEVTIAEPYRSSLSYDGVQIAIYI